MEIVQQKKIIQSNQSYLNLSWSVADQIYTLFKFLCELPVISTQNQKKMRRLRRRDRSISQSEAMALLAEAEYGVLSTADENGKPYGVPLSLCVTGNSIYFHCAVEGQKTDHIQKNKSVSFCVVGKTEILPDKFSTKYESAIISGEAEEVFQSEKRQALEGLVHKYSHEFIEEGAKYIDALDKKTRVFKISIDSITGKARR